MQIFVMVFAVAFAGIGATWLFAKIKDAAVN